MRCCRVAVLIMTKRDKLLSRVRNSTRNVSLEDFEGLIKAYGYIEEGGKHPKAIIGNTTMPYKRRSPVRPCYVRDLLEIIDSQK